MSALHAYLPQDRLRALARGESLPNRAVGSALFADISGFMPLTEALRDSLGSRRGAEELTKHLETVYAALIREVEKYGGSVISFAGDAITCWFEEQEMKDEKKTYSSSWLAATCAFALQETARSFGAVTLLSGETIPLSLKVAVVTGPARRFLVGDPTIHYVDALAGATVARISAAECLANKGDILLDEATVNAFDQALKIQEWRVEKQSGERFAVVRRQSSVEHKHTMAFTEYLPTDDLITNDSLLRPHLIPAVYEREVSGQGSFLTEFRPCAVLFARFAGIDYEAEDAQTQLDVFIRQMQHIAARYDGAMLQLTIGDKGSYAYINFGALNAHEDDTRRAVKTALELKKSTSLQLQMGLSQGVMRVGAYGGKTRKTYGALGDDVNLAARLMIHASAGEILLSGHARKIVENDFVFEPRPALKLKGKAGTVAAFAVASARQQRAIRLQEPNYVLPMVGRKKELSMIHDQLELTLQGNSQIIGIVAEAGMGKSRLVAEAIHTARQKGFAGFGGACQSDAVNTPYQTWKPVWLAFFNVDPADPLKKQIGLLKQEIESRAPARAQALPLLSILLNLEIPENDFTKTLEPQYRHSALRALLEDCLRAAAKDEPLLIVLEDLHWIDALSHNLLEELARALADSRVCFILAYRPPQLARLIAPKIEALPNFTKIELSELNAQEAEQVIRAKLAQLYPAWGGAAPARFVEKLMTRSQGNPFYLEELLNFLHDHGLNSRNTDDLNKIELPDSLHSLILSRIDQLSEREKSALRVASIVGRLFRAAWLTGYYPELGESSAVKKDLERLAKLDIAPLDTPEPELAYLFKHIVTHEVTYESLPFATRARLHERLAAYLEEQIQQGALPAASLLDTLTHHYLRSDNRAKQRAYLRQAAQAAYEASAFNTAVEYLARLVDITPAEDSQRSALALQLADAHYRQGNYPAARAAIQQAQTAATTETDRASVLAFLGEMTSGLGDYPAAQTVLAEAIPLARVSGDSLTLCRALYALGDVNWRLGKLDEAKAALDESLTLARALNHTTRELFALTRLGSVIGQQGDLDQKEKILNEVYQRAIAAGNRERAMLALNNLGVVAGGRYNNIAARDYFQQALNLAREIGAQDAIARGLSNLANEHINLGQISEAREGLREALALALRIGSNLWVVGTARNFAQLARAEGKTERALALYGITRIQPAWNSDLQSGIAKSFDDWELSPEEIEAGMRKGETLDWDATIQELLKP